MSHESWQITVHRYCYENSMYSAFNSVMKKCFSKRAAKLLKNQEFRRLIVTHLIILKLQNYINTDCVTQRPVVPLSSCPVSIKESLISTNGIFSTWETRNLCYLLSKYSDAMQTDVLTNMQTNHCSFTLESSGTWIELSGEWTWIPLRYACEKFHSSQHVRIYHSIQFCTRFSINKARWIFDKWIYLNGRIYGHG